MASGSAPSAIEPAVLAVAKMIKEHSSGRMVSSGISDVVIASVHSQKTRLKKLMIKMMIMIMIMNIIKK